MSLPAVRFRIQIGAGFSEKYHVSPLSILRHCFEVVSLGKALKPRMLHLTEVKLSTVPGRTEMAVYMILPCAKMAAGLYALRGVEMAHK